MSGGEVVVRLLHKTKVTDRAMAMVGQGILKTSDFTTLYYLCMSLDGQTGEAVRRYQTIAEACDFSRATAVRCIQKLKAVGLIDIRQRFYGKGRATRGKVATAFRLGDAALAEVGTQVNRGSVHSCTIKSPSRSFHNPGEPAQEKQAVQGEPRNGPSVGPPGNTEPADWSAHADWLANAGEYAKRWGYDDGNGARDDLSRWRRDKGDRAMLRAIERAKALGLHGARLWDFLDNTWPTGGRQDQSQRAAASPRGHRAA